MNRLDTIHNVTDDDRRTQHCSISATVIKVGYETDALKLHRVINYNKLAEARNPSAVSNFDSYIAAAVVP